MVVFEKYRPMTSKGLSDAFASRGIGRILQDLTDLHMQGERRPRFLKPFLETTMARTSTKTAMYERIATHGKKLLAIFPDAAERDPVKLCKRLRKLEQAAASIALRLCNGPEYPNEDDADTAFDRVLALVNKLLQPGVPLVPIFINRDPRGYALKISDEWMREHRPSLHSDWGGYGIIAPDLTEGD